MNRNMYQTIHARMLAEMPDTDCAHGSEHVLRVLHAALDITQTE